MKMNLTKGFRFPSISCLVTRALALASYCTQLRFASSKEVSLFKFDGKDAWQRATDVMNKERSFIGLIKTSQAEGAMRLLERMERMKTECGEARLRDTYSDAISTEIRVAEVWVEGEGKLADLPAISVYEFTEHGLGWVTDGEVVLPSPTVSSSSSIIRFPMEEEDTLPPGEALYFMHKSVRKRGRSPSNRDIPLELSTLQENYYMADAEEGDLRGVEMKYNRVIGLVIYVHIEKLTFKKPDLYWDYTLAEGDNARRAFKRQIRGGLGLNELIAESHLDMAQQDVMREALGLEGLYSNASLRHSLIIHLTGVKWPSKEKVEGSPDHHYFEMVEANRGSPAEWPPFYIYRFDPKESIFIRKCTRTIWLEEGSAEHCESDPISVERSEKVERYEMPPASPLPYPPGSIFSIDDFPDDDDDVSAGQRLGGSSREKSVLHHAVLSIKVDAEDIREWKGKRNSRLTDLYYLLPKLGEKEEEVRSGVEKENLAGVVRAKHPPTQIPFKSVEERQAIADAYFIREIEFPSWSQNVESSYILKLLPYDRELALHCDAVNYLLEFNAAEQSRIWEYLVEHSAAQYITTPSRQLANIDEDDGEEEGEKVVQAHPLPVEDEEKDERLERETNENKPERRENQESYSSSLSSSYTTSTEPVTRLDAGRKRPQPTDEIGTIEDKKNNNDEELSERKEKADSLAKRSLTDKTKRTDVRISSGKKLPSAEPERKAEPNSSRLTSASESATKAGKTRPTLIDDDRPGQVPQAEKDAKKVHHHHCRMLGQHSPSGSRCSSKQQMGRRRAESSRLPSCQRRSSNTTTIEQPGHSTAAKTTAKPSGTSKNSNGNRRLEKSDIRITTLLSEKDHPDLNHLSSQPSQPTTVKAISRREKKIRGDRSNSVTKHNDEKQRKVKYPPENSTPDKSWFAGWLKRHPSSPKTKPRKRRRLSRANK